MSSLLVCRRAYGTRFTSRGRGEPPAGARCTSPVQTNPSWYSGRAFSTTWRSSAEALGWVWASHHYCYMHSWPGPQRAAEVPLANSYCGNARPPYLQYLVSLCSCHAFTYFSSFLPCSLRIRIALPTPCGCPAGEQRFGFPARDASVDGACQAVALCSALPSGVPLLPHVRMTGTHVWRQEWQAGRLRCHVF